MSNEATKSAVLTKCEDAANVILDNDWSVAKSPTIAGKFYMEQGDSENFLTLSEDLPADAWQWGVAADILKITPTIDEFEDDLSRRQYWHELEEARMEGYEQGKAGALEKTLKDAENELFQLIMDEIGSSFHTSIIHTIRKLKESPRPSDALLRDLWTSAINWFTDYSNDSSDQRFNQWLATIPTDPLKADRDWLAANFTSGTLEKELQRLCYNPEFIGCLKRLAGMEVGNG